MYFSCQRIRGQITELDRHNLYIFGEIVLYFQWFITGRRGVKKTRLNFGSVRMFTSGTQMCTAGAGSTGMNPNSDNYDEIYILLFYG